MYTAIKNYVFDGESIFCTCHSADGNTHVDAIRIAAAMNAMTRQENRERTPHPAVEMPLGVSYDYDIGEPVA